MDIANTAVRFRQRNPAFQCLSRAAELGDQDARTAVGLMYRDGIGTKVSYPDAMKYLKEGAIQGDYNAQLALSQIYDIGLLGSPDPAQAKQWETRAYNNPAAVAARQGRQDAKDMQRMAFLGLSALVEAMSTPSVYVVR
jgi:TPR repeat protein